jgi:hypothetical protein
MADWTPIVRFMKKVDKDGPGGCWLWKAAIHPQQRYGYFHCDGQMRKAHRWIYEYMVAVIPAGLHIDHLCRVRHCVNPAHLEPVTPKENIRRGIGGQVARARNLAKTHCPYGHPYDAENTYVEKRGNRQCKECVRRRNREWKAKMKRLEYQNLKAIPDDKLNDIYDYAKGL